MRLPIPQKQTSLALAIILLVYSLVGAQHNGQKGPPATRSARPKLVLLIIADQFRADYLLRFEKLFGPNGFKRLIKRGAYFTNANYPYANTRTATGHSSIASGSIPAIHGVIGNAWYDRESGRQVYAATDFQTKGVGVDYSNSSPNYILSTTLGDQLRLSNNYQSKSIGISIKDRAATFIAGRRGTAAYWFDTKSGRMVSSTYYLKSLPEWVERFNQLHLAESYFKKKWERSLPLSAYNISDNDDAPYESAMEGTNTVFPHTIDGNKPQIENAYYHQFTGTPFANEFLLKFTINALEQEKLGQGEYPDLLAVSFSATDLVGHSFGPYSHEMEDVVVRFDEVLGELLNAVDKKVGLENTLIAFTSDHGVAPIPDYSRQHNLGGNRIIGVELLARIEKAAEERYGPGRYISALANCQFYLNQETIQKKGLNQSEIEDFVGREAIKTDGIATYFTRTRLLAGEIANTEVGRRILAGFHPKRSGDVWLLVDPFTLIAHGPEELLGTDHGTPYQYDTQVPIIMAGSSIKPGVYRSPASPIDITPTICSILGIAAPSGSVGRVLNEAIK